MLPTKWQKEEYEHGSKTRLQFSSLGKTKYTTDKVMRGMKECLHDHLASASSSKESQTGESEFMQSSKDEGSQTKLWKGEDMERRWFVCESSQIMDLLQQIYDKSKGSKLFGVFFNSIIILTYCSELDLLHAFLAWTSSRICIFSDI